MFAGRLQLRHFSNTLLIFTPTRFPCAQSYPNCNADYFIVLALFWRSRRQGRYCSRYHRDIQDM